MKLGPRLLFTGVSAAFAFAGAVAVVLESHTGSTRRGGVVTLLGENAVWFGQTCLLLALLPLAVWLPPRWVGWACAGWWLALMVWIFGPMFLR